MVSLKIPTNPEEKLRDIQSLSTVSPLWTFIKLAVISIFVVLIMACAHYASDAFVLFLCLGFILASWTQSAIIEELHDGYHYRLLPWRKANEILTRIYGSLVGISVSTGRAAHHKHHRYFGTPEDPDYLTYSTCPVGLKNWLMYVAVHFSGYGAVQGLQRKKGISVFSKPDYQHLVWTAAVHLALLSSCGCS